MPDTAAAAVQVNGYDLVDMHSRTEPLPPI
jgi:hypothetical protein